MKKHLVILMSFFSSVTLFSQVGINTENPRQLFHTDGKSSPATTNPTTGAPSVAQQIDDVVITNQGRVGIGTIAPTNSLHVKADTNPLKLEGVQSGNRSTDQILAINNTGVVKSIGTLNTLAVPTPAIFRLETKIDNFLNGANPGVSSVIPMKLVRNNIQGLTYNTTTSTITLPAGVYQFTFVYEAINRSTNPCTLSSYFIDFPLDNGVTRIHSNASHTGGGQGIHGGTITYATTVPANRTYPIHLGRGQAGNCVGAGLELKENSTQLLVFKIGD